MIEWDYGADITVPGFPALVLPPPWLFVEDARDDLHVLDAAEPPPEHAPVLSALEAAGLTRELPGKDLARALGQATRGARFTGQGVEVSLRWRELCPRIEVNGRARKEWRARVAQVLAPVGAEDVRKLLRDDAEKRIALGIGAAAFGWYVEVLDDLGELRWHPEGAVASIASFVHGELLVVRERGRPPP